MEEPRGGGALVAFLHALDRIGLTQLQREALLYQGIDSLHQLQRLPSNGVSEVCKRINKTPLLPDDPEEDDEVQTVTITYVAQSNLEALRYWARDHLRRGLVPVLADFDLSVADQFLLQMQLETEEKELLAYDTPTPPAKFEDPKKFRIFYKSLDTYLARLVGVNGTPFSYVIREHATVPAGTTFVCDRDALIASAPLRGPAFDADNRQVYIIIKKLVQEGDGGTWISQYERAKDGRGAILALYSHYLGDSSRNALIQDAYRRIEVTQFTGSKGSTVTFERYLMIHREAHNDLAQFGEPVHETKKVWDLLRGITSEESRLRHAMTYVQNSPECQTNFDRAAGVLSEAAGLPSVNPFASHRTVGAVHGKTSGLDPNNIGRKYSTAEWDAMSFPEKKAVFIARGTWKDKEDQGKKSDEGTKRKISAVVQEQEQASEPDKTEEDVGHAGLQFGRGVHGKIMRPGNA